MNSNILLKTPDRIILSNSAQNFDPSSLLEEEEKQEEEEEKKKIIVLLGLKSQKEKIEIVGFLKNYHFDSFNQELTIRFNCLLEVALKVLGLQNEKFELDTLEINSSKLPSGGSLSKISLNEYDHSLELTFDLP